MLTSGAAELLSLGSVLPFLAVLSDPSQLWQQPLVKSFAVSAGFTTARELLFPATFAFVAASIFAAIIRLSNLWLNGRFAAAVGSDLSCESYRRTLYQPYGVHVQRNSSSVITASTAHTGATVAALSAILQVMTSVVVAVGLFTGLLLINWLIALCAAVLFASLYLLLAISIRKQLQRNGERIAESVRQQLQALQEGLGAIRDVLLDGNQLAYVNIYRSADLPLRRLQAKNQYLASFPRFAFEAICLVMIAILGSIIVVRNGPGGSLFPLLGALALGAQRLLPALQQIYTGWATLNARKASILEVFNLLDQPLSSQLTVDDPLPFRQSLRFESVFFRYGSDLQFVINDLDLVIRPGERLGLIGTTGSGKSTTVDLLMGLLEPTSGRLLVDDIDLYDTNHPENILAWRSTIAHVPQNIYLTDSSFAENIAFGVPMHMIDFSLVVRAAQQAQISAFIESNPNGYHCFVGERGIRLSGGQRQRIGIARALYKQATVIVLDEATSALDDTTEDAVMQAVEGLSRNLTLVIVAHRLSTVQRCDRVIRLSQGRILADGPPHKVLNTTN